MALEGQQLGRYRLLRLLGSGGMGEVYLAEDARIAQQVAIKVIRSEGIAYPDSEGAKDAARLFEREAKAIARLDHPNILPLYAYGEETINDTVLTYLVMPYRKEGTLATWLRQRGSAGPLTPAEVSPLLQQAADALQHAHDQQVIHQDIKPTNFLMRARKDQPNRPDLLLADFGIAKLTSATASASQSIRGTPTYMAPEQWDGHPVSATDQYALAIMVYELLVGRPPFQGGPGQVMRQHYLTPVPPPSSLNPRLSPAIDAVLLRALAKQPGNRFPSVTAFARAFQQAADVSLPPRQDKVEPTLPVPPPRPSKQASSLESTRISPTHSDSSGVLDSTDLGAHTPLLPTEAATPARRTPPSIERSRSSTSTTIRSGIMAPTKPVKRSTSRRIVLIGLALLVVVALASGIAWLILPHNITEFDIPTSQSQPEGIVVGPDGNLWFTEYYTDKIGRISTKGTITEFALPTSQSNPYGVVRPAEIAMGPDSNLWFTEEFGNKIGRISTNGTITEFALPTPNSSPFGITAGPDGNLWFTEQGTIEGTGVTRIGRISTTGTVTEFVIPNSERYTYPYGITVGSDGNLWFTDGRDKIGRITPSGTISEFPIPTTFAYPTAITAGPDRNLWFTEDAGKIGRITPSGAITEFPIPNSLGFTGGSLTPTGITVGPDGNLWFTDNVDSVIGRITPSGIITNFPVPRSGSDPIGITAGPDGNLWFTEYNGNKIGRFMISK